MKSVELRPISFPQKNSLAKGADITNKMRRRGMRKQFLDLPIYHDNSQIITKWYTPNIWARLLFLLTGRLWIIVYSTTTDPVGAQIGNPFTTIEVENAKKIRK